MIQLGSSLPINRKLSLKFVEKKRGGKIAGTNSRVNCVDTLLVRHIDAHLKKAGRCVRQNDKRHHVCHTPSLATEWAFAHMCLQTRAGVGWGKKRWGETRSTRFSGTCFSLPKLRVGCSLGVWLARLGVVCCYNTQAYKHRGTHTQTAQAHTHTNRHTHTSTQTKLKSLKHIHTHTHIQAHKHINTTHAHRHATTHQTHNQPTNQPSNQASKQASKQAGASFRSPFLWASTRVGPFFWPTGHLKRGTS